MVTQSYDSQQLPSLFPSLLEEPTRFDARLQKLSQKNYESKAERAGAQQIPMSNQQE
jgi:hypothetical protein